MSAPDVSPGGRRGSFLFAKRRKKSDAATPEDERSSPGTKKRPVSLITTRAERKKRKSKKGLGGSTDDAVEEELSGGGGTSEESSAPMPIPQKAEEWSGGSGGGGGAGGEFSRSARSSPSTKGFISGITKIAKREGKEKKQKAGREKYKHRSSEDHKATFDKSFQESRRRSNTHAPDQGGTELDRALLLALKQDDDAGMPTTEEMRKAEELLNTLESPRVVSRREHSGKGGHTAIGLEEEKEGKEEGEETKLKAVDMYDIAFKLEPKGSSLNSSSEAQDSPSRHTLSSGYIESKLAQGLLTEAEAQTLLMTTPRTLPVGVLDAVLRFEIKRDKQLIQAKLQGSGSPRSPKDLMSSDDVTDMWNSEGRLVSLDTLCDMSGLDDMEEDDDLLLSDPDSTEEELSRSASGHLSSCVSERDELDRDPIMDISEPSSYGDELARIESLAAEARKNDGDREAVKRVKSDDSANRKTVAAEVGQEKRLRGPRPNESSSYDMDTAGQDTEAKMTKGISANSVDELEVTHSDAEGIEAEKEESAQEKSGHHENAGKKQRKTRKEKKEKKEKKPPKKERKEVQKKEKKAKKEKREKPTRQKAIKQTVSPPVDEGRGELPGEEVQKSKDPRAIFRAGSGEGGLGAALLSSPSLLVSVPVHEVAPERAPDLELDLDDGAEPNTLPLTRTPSGTVIAKSQRQVDARVQVERLGLQQRPAEPSESELELSMGDGQAMSAGMVASRTESFKNMIEAVEGARSPSITSPKSKISSRREGRLPLARRWEMMLKSNIEQADTKVQMQKLSREEKLKHEMEQERLRLDAIKGGFHYDPKDASPATCSPKRPSQQQSSAGGSSPTLPVAGRIQMFESLSDAIDDALSAHRKLKSECAKCSLNEAQAQIAANALDLLNEAAVHLQLLRDAAK